MTLENLQFRLASRPVGMAKESDFQKAAEPLRELADGEITVKTLYLSLDPAMRGWMNDAKSYIRPVAIGEVMRAGGVGEVVASKSPKYAVGDIVSGGIGVQAYWQGAADDKSASFFKVDGRLAPLTTWMNTLGMLMVGCRDNTPAIRFYWGKFLMGNRIGRMAADDFVIDVQYRFPSEAQGIEQSWLGQPGRKAASPSELFGKGSCRWR